MGPTIVWLRSDLRLADNPALSAAIAAAGSRGVIPVYVWATDEDPIAVTGGAGRSWLRHSLRVLDQALRARNSQLVLRTGPIEAALLALAEESGAGRVTWNRSLEPQVAARDARLSLLLRARGLAVDADAGLPPAGSLFDPASLLARGKPFASFAPFWRACLASPSPPRPRPAPPHVPAPRSWPPSMPFAELAVLVAAGDETSLPNGWEPGESSANGRLDRFLQDRLSGYARWRDRPAMDATSRLSPHLHFGELGPRQVWHAVRDAAARRRIDPLSFLRELGRREFAQHVLYHFPTSVSEPMLPTFLHFPWLSDPAGLQAWQRGMTGYPLVDAGMRELYETGFMHGRARMVTASFLVKHLLVSWREGARWFWDRSVDADLAANTFGWQLCAGSGSLEGPTFRFLNPVSQGAAFDPAGAYVRRWIPQLERLPQRFVHAPWTAPRDVLAASRLELGRDYPWPIVEPRAARARALAAFETMRVRSRARP